MRFSAFIQLMIRESQEGTVVPENRFRLQYLLHRYGSVGNNSNKYNNQNNKMY